MPRFFNELHFAESANAFINDANNTEASQLLKPILIQHKTTKKIFSLVEKVKGEVKRRSYSNAETTCTEIARLIKLKAFENENNKTKQKCHDELRTLVEKLIETKQLDLALLLVESQFHLIKHSYRAQKQLKKFEDLGGSLMDISQNFHYESESVKVKQIYWLYDEILKNMQLVNDVDMNVKTKSIAWFMYYYGTSSNSMKDFTKSIEIFPKVIFLMNTSFGDHAANYRVFSLSHHNYAYTFKATNRLIEAKQMYEEALKFQEQASDWPSEKLKRDSILLTSRVLHEANTKLDQ